MMPDLSKLWEKGEGSENSCNKRERESANIEEASFHVPATN
jgi:hypothetical protein